jgi:hypothetical protein
MVWDCKMATEKNRGARTKHTNKEERERRAQTKQYSNKAKIRNWHMHKETYSFTKKMRESYRNPRKRPPRVVCAAQR